jgi:hypothetical protein
MRHTVYDDKTKPPFEPGEVVLCINGTEDLNDQPHIVGGEHYTIREIYWSDWERCWMVNLEETYRKDVPRRSRRFSPIKFTKPERRLPEWF